MNDLVRIPDILDACCGSRMFWIEKNRKDVLYMDIRSGDFSWNNQKWSVSPDIIGDFRKMPFEDNTFSLVVFDPPHITHGSPSGIINQKYGMLNKDNWKKDIQLGLSECLRVCKIGGFINFKWSDSEISMSEVSPLFPCPPLYAQRRSSKGSIWVMFRKE